MSKSLRIIFFGTPEFAANYLSVLLSSKHKVVGVFTKIDTPAGRGKKIKMSPVKVLAKEKNIPIFQPVSLNQQKDQQVIADLNADIIVVVAYGLILPKAVLDIPRFGCINVHGSLLPRWRGAAPIQRSIWAGDNETGITILKMNSRIDAGDILYQRSCPILNNDTSITLCNKLAKLGQNGLIETLKQITIGKITPKVQDESLVKYAEKLSKHEAHINWSLPAVQLERCIRAFNPWPISWMRIDKQLIKIWQASVLHTTASIESGTIIIVNEQGIQVATIEGILNLEFLQLAGRKPMSVREILNSRRELFVPGKRFN